MDEIYELKYESDILAFRKIWLELEVKEASVLKVEDGGSTLKADYFLVSMPILNAIFTLIYFRNLPSLSCFQLADLLLLHLLGCQCTAETLIWRVRARLLLLLLLQKSNECSCICYR